MPYLSLVLTGILQWACPPPAVATLSLIFFLRSSSSSSNFNSSNSFYPLSFFFVLSLLLWFSFFYFILLSSEPDISLVWFHLFICRLPVSSTVLLPSPSRPARQLLNAIDSPYLIRPTPRAMSLGLLAP